MKNDKLEAELYELWRQERDKYSDEANRRFCEAEMAKHYQGYVNVTNDLDKKLRMADVNQTGVSIAGIMLVFFLCGMTCIGLILILTR